MKGPSGRQYCGIWATPAAWLMVACVAVRVDRAEIFEATLGGLVVVLSLGVVRTVAASRGGVAGRLAEILTLALAVVWVLTEPPAVRLLRVTGGSMAIAALATLGVWAKAPVESRRIIAAVLAAAAAAVTAAGVVGAPMWAAKALFIMASMTVVAWVLARVVRPEIALAATLAAAVTIGPAHTLAWILPVVAALAAWILEAGHGRFLPILAVAAAALPPAGCILAVALLTISIRHTAARNVLLATAVAAAIAWWRLPTEIVLGLSPQWSVALTALPVTFSALPFLLPVAFLALVARPPATLEARDGLALGLLVTPWLALGPWSAGAIAALWLLVLPAALRDPHLSRWTAGSLPWSLAAPAGLLLLSPWGGSGGVPEATPILAATWLVALMAGRLRWPVARVIWLLPVAGLAWTTPVIGIEHHLRPGESLELTGTTSSGWVFEAESTVPNGIAAGSAALSFEDPGVPPLVAGIEIPTAGSPARHPLQVTTGLGRNSTTRLRGIAVRPELGTTRIHAATGLRLRAEGFDRWQSRRQSTLIVLLGAVALLAAAHLACPTSVRALPTATGIAVAGCVATGCAAAPLARAAFHNGPDLAVAILLGSWAAIVGRFRNRRFVAAAVLLVPLAVAQPMLRGPVGDEAYHVVILKSLTDDLDLSISDDIDPDDPATAPYLEHGDSLIHSPVLAFLTLPGFVLAGHAGALAIAALMVAAGLALTARRALQLGLSRRTVDAAWLAAVLTFPVVTFATQLWPAPLGILAVGLLLVASGRGWRVGAVVTTVVVMLVKVRLGLIALPMLAATVFRKPSRRRLLASVFAAAALVTAVALFGLDIGKHRLLELVPADPLTPVIALWGLLWDAAGGLAFANPLWLACLVAVPALWRRSSAGERALIVGAGLTVCALLPRGEWYGGGSPPARYLVPLTPLMVLALATLLGSRHGRRLASLTFPWAAVVGWTAATRPLWLFNPVDGGWWFADRLGRLLEVPTRDLFPALLRPAPAAIIAPAVVLTVAAVWIWRGWRGAAAATTLGLAVVLFTGTTRRETRVHAEDPHIRHTAGTAEPPSGTFFRAVHGIGWRLPAGAALEIPWRPPLQSDLAARVRVVGPRYAAGILRASWDDGPPTANEVAGDWWHTTPLPAPTGLGRGVLRIEWHAHEDRPVGDLVVDLVEAAP